MVNRRKTPTVRIGALNMGSGHPIVVQSMTDTPTADVKATLQQTLELVEAGAEMVRWTINDDAAALGALEVLRQLRRDSITVPVAGDFHFNGHLLLQKHEALAEALDKYRINPGNVGAEDPFARIIRLAVKHGKAVRIGVNGGSIDRKVFQAAMEKNKTLPAPSSAREVMYHAVIESACSSARQAIELGLSPEKLVLSVKLSSVEDVVEVNRRLALACPYALHLGLTEAGGGVKGIASSAAALAVLLAEGIGDTIRVSLTPEPGVLRSREVDVCREILQSMGFRFFKPSVISCPGCGRTHSKAFQILADEVRSYIDSRLKDWLVKYPGVERLKVAVMGCVVNGPGESAHADIGISLPGAAEALSAPVYIDGEKAAVLQGEKISQEFTVLLEQYVQKKFSKT